VLAIEASRLARNGRDWHTLLEFCTLVNSLIIDADGVYDPKLINDRLLLERHIQRTRTVDLAPALARSIASQGSARRPSTPVLRSVMCAVPMTGWGSIPINGHAKPFTYEASIINDIGRCASCHQPAFVGDQEVLSPPDPVAGRELNEQRLVDAGVGTHVRRRMIPRPALDAAPAPRPILSD
jgi:hypothetical protein